MVSIEIIVVVVAHNSWNECVHDMKLEMMCHHDEIKCYNAAVAHVLAVMINSKCGDGSLVFISTIH